jgi:ketosteroid isomerase-like protein
VSRDNVELHRRLLAAFEARDIDTMIALSALSIELHSVLTAVEGAVYRGHYGLRTWHRDIEDAWGHEVRVESPRYFDLGEQTLASYVLRARGRQSGVEIATRWSMVSRWRDGLCVYWKSYTDGQQALVDLGVTEDELEPIVP